MDSLAGYSCYDHLLHDPLKAAGWQVEEISWRTKDVNWSAYDLVIIRSTWDYQNDPAAFLAVIKTIERQTLLKNNFATVKWNMDKRYLKDLQKKGIPIVPTLWSADLKKPIPSFFNALDCQEIIIKPTISANAHATFRLDANSFAEQQTKLQAVFKDRPYMVQPFVKKIISEGEYSLFYFDGEFSHSIIKKPKEHDFRVQEEHGGRLRLIEVQKELLDFGKNIMATIAETPLYARVDLVRLEDGSFALIELELIEPSLYFNMDPTAIGRFVSKIISI